MKKKKVLMTTSFLSAATALTMAVSASGYCPTNQAQSVRNAFPVFGQSRSWNTQSKDCNTSSGNAVKGQSIEALLQECQNPRINQQTIDEICRQLFKNYQGTAVDCPTGQPTSDCKECACTPNSCLQTDCDDASCTQNSCKWDSCKDANSCTPTPTPKPETPAPTPKPEQPAPTPEPETPAPDQTFSEMQTQILNIVNKERAAQGLSALKLDEKLSKVATAKSQDMADLGYFSHTSPTYGSPFDMMKQFGVSYSTAGENIAKGQTTAEQVMRDWMNSEGHRANILNKNFEKLGVGIVKDASGRVIWTQMFIKD